MSPLHNPPGSTVSRPCCRLFSRSPRCAPELGCAPASLPLPGNQEPGGATGVHSRWPPTRELSGDPPGLGSELLPAHLPPGRPQTNKYLQTSGKAPNKPRAPAGCPLPGGPAGLGVPLPPGSQPRDRRAGGADKEENQLNHFLSFHLDFTGPPARLCTQIDVAFKRLRSKTPTKQTGQPGPTTSSLPPNSPRVYCRLGCLSAWKKERRGSLRSIYIHIFSIKTIK